MDAYSGLISLFIQKQFPIKLCSQSPELLNILTDEILGTKQTRYGPKPAPEIIVAIREVISLYIAQNKPLPFMVPWGSEKPDNSRIDIAEFSAIKVMDALNTRIKQFYAPGAQFRIRLEDASAPHLFYENQAEAWETAKAYTGDFIKLLKILGVNSFVTAAPESLYVNPSQFAAAADLVLPYFQHALQVTEEANPDSLIRADEILSATGWKGGINSAMKEFYLKQYLKIYPEKTRGEHIRILARYFAAALARKKLSIRGDLPEWNGKFLDLSFVTSPPGTENLFNRRVIYRTMPLDFTSLHIAPWRGKGYLEITNDNEVCPKLASFHDKLLYHKHEMILEHNGDSVVIQADYILN